MKSFNNTNKIYMILPWLWLNSSFLIWLSDRWVYSIGHTIHCKLNYAKWQMRRVDWPSVDKFNQAELSEVLGLWWPILTGLIKTFSFRYFFSRVSARGTTHIDCKYGQVTAEEWDIWKMSRIIATKTTQDSFCGQRKLPRQEAQNLDPIF